MGRGIRLAAGELRRVYDEHGPRGVFGGSYGWASAGRFHHAPGQLHRFLNTTGGYVRSVNSYSSGAATVIFPHVLGPQEAASRNNVGWDELAAHSDMILAFGGMALKNNDVGSGGASQHIAGERLRTARARGAEFHLISPLRDDMEPEIGAVWHPIRPGTDVALMLGIAHTLVSEGLHDRAFLDRYCVGYEAFEDYLLGRSDNRPKDAAWAAAICDLPAETIARLARRCARQAHADHLLAIAAARPSRRTAGVDGARARGDPGPGRIARRRVCLCAGLDRPYRQPERRGAAADTAAGPQQHRRFHPGRAHRRHAAEPRRAVRLRRPASDLSRHQAGLLGRRQPVPSPSGSAPAARRPLPGPTR